MSRIDTCQRFFIVSTYGRDSLLQLTLNFQAIGSFFDLICPKVFWNLGLVSASQLIPVRSNRSLSL